MVAIQSRDLNLVGPVPMLLIVRRNKAPKDDARGVTRSNAMRANIPYNDVDERGIFSLLAALTHAALVPNIDSGVERKPPKPGLFERFDRWAARARQRDLERWLAESKDVFELERRIRERERRPYY